MNFILHFFCIIVTIFKHFKKIVYYLHHTQLLHIGNHVDNLVLNF
jgi:hypothetical protein